MTDEVAQAQRRWTMLDRLIDGLRKAAGPDRE
jgi:hypothetical protein